MPILADGMPSKLRVPLHKRFQLFRFQQPVEIPVHLSIFKSTTHHLVRDASGVEAASMMIEDLPQKLYGTTFPPIWGGSENRSPADSPSMCARFTLTCTGRAWCGGREVGIFSSKSSIETFQWVGRRTTSPRLRMRRWVKARRQACSSAPFLVGASLETQSWMPSPVVKLLGNFNTHFQDVLAESVDVIVLQAITD